MYRRLVFSLSLFILSGSFASGQHAPRHLMLEHFTNTRCTTCPPRNEDLFELLDQNPGVVHHLSIHPSVPYSSCVLYQHNPIHNNSRKNLYGVSYTPQSYLWGSFAQVGVTLLPDTTLQNNQGQTASIQIKVDENTSGPLPGVNIEVRTMESVPAGNWKLFAAIVEKELFYVAPNGETEHHNVLRAFLPDETGDTYTPAPAGESVFFNYTYTPDAAWNMSEIYILAFVQNMDTKEILNSGTKFDLGLQLSATTNEATAAVSGGIPPYTYQWNDPGNQTTATATGLTPGVYMVTVTDSVGISIADTVRVGEATGIEEEILAAVNIYPSPASDVLSVDLGEYFREINQVTLYNHTGQESGRWEVAGSISPVLEVSVRQLPAGIYYLGLQGKNPAVFKKIVVRH